MSEITETTCDYLIVCGNCGNDVYSLSWEWKFGDKLICVKNKDDSYSHFDGENNEWKEELSKQ